MRNILRIILCIVCLVQTGCRYNSGTHNRPHWLTIERGDCLDITLSSQQNSTTQRFRVVVDSAGSITLPLVGKVNVVGRKLSEARLTIENAYVPREGDLSVRLARCSSGEGAAMGKEASEQ